MSSTYALTMILAEMKKGPRIALLLALTNGICAAQQTTTAAPEPLPKKIASQEEAKIVASQIADLIAPFTLDDLRNGFKNEPSLSNYPPGVVVKKGSGVQETRTMTKVRPAGGKVSVEVALMDGNIEEVAFKLLPAKAGFQDIWNAKPVVVLSKRVASNASNDIGFGRIEIRQGDTTTRYELP
jgi:hypothetical protein